MIRIPLNFDVQCKGLGLPTPVAEFRFDATRRWRFDWCWPAQKLALEVEGGAFTGGRHTRGAGFVRDLEKYNAACVAGYRLLRVTPTQVQTGAAVELARLALLQCADSTPPVTLTR